MFSCYDLAGHKITTSVYTDCNPSLDIVMTASEFAALKDAIANAGNSNLTVAQLFAYPSVLEIQQFFSYGFFLPLVVFLIAHGFGVIVNFFKH